MSQPEFSGNLADQRGHRSSSHALESAYEPLRDTESENWFDSHFCNTPSMRPSCLSSLSLANLYKMEILIINYPGCI